MNPTEGHNFMVAAKPMDWILNLDSEANLGFQGVGQGAVKMNAMAPREGNNVITCGQTYGQDLVLNGA